MDTRRARQLTLNIVSGGGRYGVAAVLALAVTPYALGVLGDQRFGVWALAGAVLSTLRLLDLGLNRALVRAVADAAGRDALGAARPAFGTARALALLLAPTIAAPVWLVRRPLVDGLFRVPGPLQAAAEYVVVGTAIVVAVEVLFAPYQAALDGLGRMDLTNAVDTVQRVLSALGVVLVLSMGWGLPGLVWKNVATALLAGLAYRLLLHRRSPDLAGTGFRLEVPEARSLLSFGRHVQVVNLGSLLIEPVSKVLLSREVGLGAVTAFELATRVTSQVGGAFLALSAALFPAAAELRAATGSASRRAVAALYDSAARYLAWVALPAYGLLVALAAPFVLAWLGPDYDRVAWAIAVLGAGWLLAVVSTPAFVIAQAAGRERLSTAASLVTVGVAIGSMAVLVGPFGLEGVVVGVALGLVGGGVAILAAFARAYGLGRRVITVVGWRAVAAAATGAGASSLAVHVLPPGLIGLVLAGMTGLAVYGAAMMAGGAVGTVEREALRAILARPILQSGE
jgi:O-antigen/teichoic acid export membrane protein